MSGTSTLKTLQSSLAQLPVPAGSREAVMAAVAEVQQLAPSAAPRVLAALEQLCNDVRAGPVAAVNGSGGAAAPKAQPATAAAAPPSIPDIDILTRVPGLSCLAPRGKFELLLCADRVALRNAKATLVLPLAQLARVYILDGMGGDKAGKVVLLMQLQPGAHVAHGKQKLSSFAIEVRADAQLDVPAPRGAGPSVKGAAPVVLCNLLGSVGVTDFVAPDGSAFQGAGGARAVEALFKLNSGWLVPLKAAIVYVGSKCWEVPLGDILGVDLPGAHTGRRTFDVVLHARDGAVIAELQQLDAKHLAAFEAYMATTRLRIVAGVAPDDAGPSASGGGGGAGARKRHAAAAAADIAAPAGGAGDDSDDDESDADFDPQGSSGDEGEGAGLLGRKRKRGEEGAAGAGPIEVDQDTSSSDDESDSSGDEHDYVSDDLTDDGGPGA